MGYNEGIYTLNTYRFVEKGIFKNKVFVFDEDRNLVFAFKKPLFKKELVIYGDKKMTEKLMTVKWESMSLKESLELSKSSIAGSKAEREEAAKKAREQALNVFLHIHDDVADEDVGEVVKKRFAEIVKTKWELFDRNGNIVGTLTESSTISAIAVRLMDILDRFVRLGIITDIIMFFIPWYFVILDKNGNEVARIEKRIFKTGKCLVVKGEGGVDRRLIVASAVIFVSRFGV